MSAWPETALSDVVADATPGFACGEDVEDGVFQFRMNNITTEGQLDLSKRRRVPRDYRNIDRFLVQPGDVLFNATNSPDLVGKTAFFLGLEEPAVFSNHFLRLRPRDGEIDGRYLTRWLNLQFLQGRFKGICRQWVNQATVGRDALLSLKVPLPPLPEQRRIAEILDKADALRAKRRAALARLDTLTQSIFLDMFGDPATNPRGWPRRVLDELCSIDATLVDPTRDEYRRLLHYGPDRIERDTGTLLPAKTAEEDGVTSGKFLFDEHAILYSKIRPNLNKVALARERALCSADVYPISVTKGRLTREFLWCLLRDKHFLAYAAEFSNRANIPKINRDQLLSYRALCPPISLQEDFTRRVTAVDQLRASCLHSARCTEQLFITLQHTAFGGKL